MMKYDHLMIGLIYQVYLALSMQLKTLVKNELYIVQVLRQAGNGRKRTKIILGFLCLVKCPARFVSSFQLKEFSFPSLF